MIKAVIFDMDGVLVDSEPENLRLLKEFMEGYDVHADDAFLASLVGSSYTFTCEECIRIMKKDWSVKEFSDIYEAYAAEHPFRYGEVGNPYVKETLDWLKEYGYKTAVASSSFLSQIEEMEQDCGLDGCFDVKISGEMFEESKPNPEIYLHTAQALGVKPAECLAIEDSSYGIEAARRAGMKVFAYRDERYGVDQSKADSIIDDMRDVVAYLK